MTARYTAWLAIMDSRDASITAMATLALALLALSWAWAAGLRWIARQAQLPPLLGSFAPWQAEFSLIVMTYAYIVFYAATGYAPLG